MKKVIGLSMLQQSRNTKNNISLTEAEKDFIWHVRTLFLEQDPKAKFEFNVLTDKSIEFKVNTILVGKVKLRDKMAMLISPSDNTKWLPIKDKPEYLKAKEKVTVWLDYYKRNI
jgi:hypothetical protein